MNEFENKPMENSQPVTPAPETSTPVSPVPPVQPQAAPIPPYQQPQVHTVPPQVNNIPPYQPGTPVPPVQMQYQAPEKKDSKGLAIASLVVGIVGIVLEVFCCCFPYLGALCAILAIIFGIVGIKSSGKTMAIVGLCLGIATLLLGIVMIALVMNGSLAEIFYEMNIDPDLYQYFPELY